MQDTEDLIDTEAQKAADEEAARQRRRQQVEDIRWLMDHPAGRRFVTGLLDESGVFRTSFHTDPAVMAMREGRKQIGYRLTGDLLEFAPEGYMQLLKEYEQ